MFRALLIGVDFYFPNRLPNDGYYPSLHGCVADASRVEALLRSRVDEPAEITTLYAAHDANDTRRPKGSRASWPTAANITAALEHLVATSAPGDQVYVHYSGHGGRVVTKYPALKGATGIDEGIVPADIGGDDSANPTIVADRYVRDVYLARYLHALSLKGAIVTLVFDSCHSGGATRGIESGDAYRTAIGPNGNLDTSVGSDDPKELAAQVRSVWTALKREESERRLVGGAFRAASMSATWVPDAGRYVFLAACRETESALETTLDDGTRGGVLTDAFISAVGTPSDRYTWRTVFDQVSARMRARYPEQTPMLFGEAGREVLGVRLRPVDATVTVTNVDPASRRVTLSAGLAMGLMKGARFEIHALGTTDFSHSESIVANAVVVSTGAVESSATIEWGDVAKIKAGAPAVQLSVPVRHRVVWVAQSAFANDGAARDALEAAIKKSGAGFLELVNDGATPDVLVGLDVGGRYQIFDGAIVGGAYVPLAGVPSPLAATADGARDLVTRLLRIARYRTLVALTQRQSPLNRAVRVELLTAPTGFQDGDSLDGGDALAAVNGRYEIDHGTVLFIRVTNNGGQNVNVAALDFGSRWGIEMLAPAVNGGPFEVVGAHEEKTFPVQMYVPEGMDADEDIIKVFITLGPADFQRMRQSSLDDVVRRGVMRGESQSALDRAFDVLEEKANTRAGMSLATPGAEWTTTRFDVRETRQTEVVSTTAVPMRGMPSRGPSNLAAPTSEPIVVVPEEAPTSEPIELEELAMMLRAQADGGAALIDAMFTPSVDTMRILGVARGPDVARAQSRGFELPVVRGVWPVVGTPIVDEAQLAAFNAQFATRLAAPVSADMAREMKFQTYEDWKGYVTTGAYSFVTGEPVARPLWYALHDPPNDMTHALRPEHDPMKAPLRMGIFADFGNGLYASRENARRIIERKYPYVFHLGDVYYDGNEREFREYFAEPLAPLLEESELFVLSGNHEMYSRGVNFQKYVMQKSARHDGKQRQVAEMFRLRGKGLQVIGIDTMWCGWEGKLFRGNEPRIDNATRALLERWLTEGDPDGFTILMTSNEPWSTESAKTTDMLDDFEPYIRRGLIDMWFWGNVHHAAVYDSWKPERAEEHGFVGACVGHGGYPFYTQGAPKQSSGGKCRWSERKHRFWPFDKVRPDVGLNGWSELELKRDVHRWTATLTFRDWVGRDRSRTVIEKSRGMGPRVISVEENTSADPNSHDWKPLP